MWSVAKNLSLRARSSPGFTSLSESGQSDQISSTSSPRNEVHLISTTLTPSYIANNSFNVSFSHIRASITWFCKLSWLLSISTLSCRSETWPFSCSSLSRVRSRKARCELRFCCFLRWCIRNDQLSFVIEDTRQIKYQFTSLLLIPTEYSSISVIEVEESALRWRWLVDISEAALGDVG